MSKLFPLPAEKKLVSTVRLCACVPVVNNAYIKVGPSLAGYVLAEDVYAPHNIPSTQTTSVDGYALLCKSDRCTNDSYPSDVYTQLRPMDRAFTKSSHLLHITH